MGRIVVEDAMDRMSAIDRAEARRLDPVDEAALESFPASDPPGWIAAGAGGPRRAEPRPAPPAPVPQPSRRPRVRIYRPSKSAMQSARANTRRWRLEFVPGERPLAEPLMGWIGMRDPRRGMRIDFPSRAAAVEFAERQGLAYEVLKPHDMRVRPKSYAANFRWNDPTLPGGSA